MRVRDLLRGAALGTGLMYILDPGEGRRRRARVRDVVVHGRRKAEDGLMTALRDLRQRASGVGARAESRLRREPEVDDAVLAARVRSRIGWLVSHPHSIEVAAENGRVTLCGPILSREVDRVLERVQHVRGVKEVVNELEVHESAGRIPGLQGGRRREPRFELRQRHWSPGARLLVGTGAAALLAWSRRFRAVPRLLARASGFALLARAASNLELRQLVGIGAGRGTIVFHKTLNVTAPVETVFDFWSRFENFPLFMSHLREVRDTGGGSSHWVAAGPAGLAVEWDALITRLVPNELIAWTSAPGATVANAGMVRFQSNPDGGTRLDIHLSYTPPAGALGHVVASLLGADPKHAMDEDLVRFKSLIEQGKATADGREVLREELEGPARAA
ncbi:MAG: BON domain-containing protein [Gemmatimonadetes bacterium]|nr:BON domain-containing protein [Gemmatimonadota bacterium]